jgi:hypothetical protein
MEQTVYTTIWKKLGIDERETYLLSEHNALLEAHPDWEEQLRILDAPTPPVPTLEQAKAAKIAELQRAAYAASQEGIATSPGLKMKYGEQDCVLVDGIVRYAERKGLTTVPKLVEADGTIHTDVTLANGVIISVEQFEAANAMDTKLRDLGAQVMGATTVEDVLAIAWSLSGA